MIAMFLYLVVEKIVFPNLGDNLIEITTKAFEITIKDLVRFYMLRYKGSSHSDTLYIILLSRYRRDQFLQTTF